VKKGGGVDVKKKTQTIDSQFGGGGKYQREGGRGFGGGGGGGGVGGGGGFCVWGGGGWGGGKRVSPPNTKANLPSDDSDPPTKAISLAISLLKRDQMWRKCGVWRGLVW